MKLKNYVLIIILFLAQSINAQSIINLEDKAENYTQTETGYILHFELNATTDEYLKITEKISALSDRLKMVSTGPINNVYTCEFTVDHQNQPEYVYKMLLSIGIQGIYYKGENFEIIKIVDILKSYQ